MGFIGIEWRVVLLALAVLSPGVSPACLTCRNGLECKDVKVDLAFVVDGSGSICTDQQGGCDNWITVLSFIVRIINLLDVGPDKDRVALVTYANKAKVEFTLNQHTTQSSLIDAMRDIKYPSGNTNTSGALYIMQKDVFVEAAGDRPNVQNVAIVITDGISTWDAALTVPYANEASARNIRIYSIGITDAIDEREVRLISSDPKLYDLSYFILPQFNDLQYVAIVEAIHDSVCKNYEINNKLFQCPGTYSQTGCYVVIDKPLSRLGAQLECARIGLQNTPAVTGELVTVNSQALQDEMTRMISALTGKGVLTGSTGLWTGATRTEPPNAVAYGFTNGPVWTWSNNTHNTLIGAQGCYVAQLGTTKDLPVSGPFIGNTLDNCTQTCVQQGYNVAGIQSGNLCSCGSSYGQFGGSTACNSPCSSIDNSWGSCGGPNDNNIYLNGGAYAEWAYEEPTNTDGAGLCGVISGRWNRWQMAAEQCYKKQLYICQFSFDLAQCRQTSSSQNYRVISNKCLFVSRDTSDVGAKSWFDAQLGCAAIGGELLRVESKEEHAQLKTVMSDVGLAEQMYWVNLLGKRWTWQSGVPIRGYHNWGPDQPSDSASKDCMMLKYNTNTKTYTWNAEECSTTLPAICRIELTQVVSSPAATTEASQTTNFTNQPSTQATATPTAPTNGTGLEDPDAGASTAAGGLGTVEIVVICVLGGLVLVGLIVGIIACIYYKKGNKKQTTVVSPDKADYLTANMLTPYNTYYHQDYNNYNSAAGVVMNPTDLDKKDQNVAYMSFNGGQTVDYNSDAKMNKKSKAYMEVPYTAYSGSQTHRTEQHTVKMSMSEQNHRQASVHQSGFQGVSLQPAVDFSSSSTPLRSSRRMTSNDSTRFSVNANGNLIQIE